MPAIKTNTRKIPAGACRKPTGGRACGFPLVAQVGSTWGALGLLAAGLIATVWAAHYIKAGVDAAAQREFDFACKEIRIDIKARLEAGAQILRSGVALFAATETVSRGEWHAFTRRLQIEQHLPGIQGIGFAALIPRAQLDPHVQSIRGEGFPDYQVWPAGEREEYAPVVFLEPFEGRNLRAFGYDTMSEPVRRAAMERARDENTAALSGKVVLVQETCKDPQAGVMFYAPVYRHGLPIETIAQRRAAIQGWVYSPYRMNDLMHGTLKHWDVEQKGRQIVLQIYDGEVRGADTLLFDSQGFTKPAQASNTRFTRLTPVDFAGRRWTLRLFRTGAPAALADYGSIWLVLFGGTMVSLLLSGLMFWRQQRIRFYREKLEAAEALISSEERFRQVAESAGEWIWEVDATGVYRYCSSAAETLIGYTPAELVGRLHFYDLFLPEVRERLKADALAAFERRLPFRNFVNQNLHKNGTTVIMETSGQPILDEQGGLLGYRGTDTDVTQRVQTEEQLRVQIAAMEAAAEAILIADRKERVTWVNHAFTTLTGYTAAEIIGRQASLLAPGHKPDAIYMEIQQALRAGQVWRGELASRRKDGCLYNEEVTITPVFDETGVVTNQIAIKKDITERKRMESFLREQQRLASLGTLARGMAHAVNNPLMGIMNYAQLVKDRMTDHASLAGYADEILVEGRRVATMTHSLLQYTQQQEAQPFDLVAPADLLAAIRPPVSALAQQQGIVLSIDLPADLPRVRCRPRQFGHVLTALLTNAVEAFGGETPDAGRRITISAREVVNSDQSSVNSDRSSVNSDRSSVNSDRLSVNSDRLSVNSDRLSVNNERSSVSVADTDHRSPVTDHRTPHSAIRITVADNGPGMPAEVREHAFDPFFTTKDRALHAGLGLWISRSIVHEHDGEISVESPLTTLRAGEAGHGTRVHVHLPVGHG